VNRRTRLQANPDKPLRRKSRMRRASADRAATGAVVRSAATGRQPIARVSKKRAAENRERAAMADRLWPDRRDGIVMCGCGRPDCNRRADDLHEPLSRARGGSITDGANARPLSRHCHDEITLGPDWAYEAGLLKHDGLCCQGRKVCARYAEAGEVA